MMFDYPFDLGIGEVTANGVKNNQFCLLHMSVPSSATDEEKVAMHFWLNHGLVWYYAFNQEEAIKCFQKALDISPKCVFAHWGISISHGPNYNTEAMSKDSFPSAKEAYFHAQKVLTLLKDRAIVEDLTEVEVAVLSALGGRFNPVDDSTPDDALLKANTDDYAKSLQKVYTRFPSHACVACLYAESVMNYSPWKLWNLESGIPEPHTNIAKEVLDKALRHAPHHPGLNHFAVHLMEMSSTPQAALPSCDVLRFHFPDAGHLIHMPSHIYVLLGMYDEATACNLEAIVADEKYVEKEGVYNCYTGYRIHNIHFVAYAAMFAGQYERAVEATRKIKETLPDDLLSNPFMAKYFEAFLSIEWHVLIRFGMWEEILSKPVLEDTSSPVFYPYTLAMQHYARGIAFAVTAEKTKERQKASLLADAEEELSKMLAVAKAVPADRVLHNNLCSDLIKIGEAMLRGEIQYRRGCYDEAFSFLRDAVKQSDSLVYDEPWGWMQPPRHALGALLLEQNRVEEAEIEFRKDMDTSFFGRCHPNNLWALSGLQRCLELYPLGYNSATSNPEKVEPSTSLDTEASVSDVVPKQPSLRQLNVNLDWEHIGSGLSSPLHSRPIDREKELGDVRDKIRAIKARARDKTDVGQKDIPVVRPWLDDGTTSVACMCAKSGCGNDELHCSKRQKLS